jgi:hypothetical protein
VQTYIQIRQGKGKGEDEGEENDALTDKAV